MTYSHIIVIDQGTHSTRAIIYNHLGEAVFKSQQEVDLFYRNSSYIEQDGKKILASCQGVLADAHQFIEKNRLEKIAVALTTQRSTVIAWNKDTGEAITPALSWLDTRAQDELEELSIDEKIVKVKTGLPLSPHYGASKLQWLLKHDKNVQVAKQKNCLKFGPLAAYLIYNLIEDQPCYVDYSNAHRTLLWNLQSKEWDADLLDVFSIEVEQLPEPVPSSFGYGKLASNTSFVNIGTGAFVLANSKQQPVLNTNLLASITYSSKQEQEYALEGTVNGAGAAMTWAENEWGINDIESIAWKNVENVPIFLNTIGGLGSPFWQSDIRPTFLASNQTHNDYRQEQCMAALMESIVFLLVINIEEMRTHSVDTKQLLVAGGMSKDEHLCQCLADLCSVPVTVSSFKEATSRGAAWLALEKPDWNVIDSKQFNYAGNPSLQSRFEEFKKAINKKLH